MSNRFSYSKYLSITLIVKNMPKFSLKMSKMSHKNLKMSKHNINECQKCQNSNKKCQKCHPKIIKCQMSKALPLPHSVVTDFLNSFPQYLNIGFTALFTLEVVLRILAIKWQYFRSPWNVFDFIVVGLSLAGMLLCNFLAVPDSTCVSK